MKIQSHTPGWSPGLIARVMLLLVFISGQWSMVNGQSPEDLYKTAATQYKANQFEQAAAAYEKILAQGYRSPEVYYNLGNCYFKLHKTSKAILNFERAHRLAPEDEDIAHNLKLSESHAVDKLQPVPQLGIIKSWNNFVESQTSKGWGIFAVVCIWVALIFFALYILAGRKGAVMFAGVLFLVLSAGFLYLSVKQNHAEENSDMAILLIENVSVKSAPDAGSTDLFTIHEGIKLELCDQVGNWTKIKLADGKVGWLEKNAFEKI